MPVLPRILLPQTEYNLDKKENKRAIKMKQIIFPTRARNQMFLAQG